jgi:hypothetical protein
VGNNGLLSVRIIESRQNIVRKSLVADDGWSEGSSNVCDLILGFSQ